MRYAKALGLMMVGMAVCWPGGMEAHPGHDSVTEAVFRSESGMLEVTVSVHVGDLEEALTRKAGSRVRVHQDEDAVLDRRLADYLRSVFSIEVPTGDRPELVWVGREMKVADGAHVDGGLVLLHFEFALPEGLEKSKLKQGLLCEVHDDQINLVHLREGDRKVTLGFSPLHEAREVTFTE